MSYVYDSSAMLAHLKSEVGGDKVRDFLADADAPQHAHAVNLCEVFYNFLREADNATAHDAIATLHDIGVVECNDMDGVFWRDIAGLVAQFRSGAGKRLALGDAFGVALARRLDASFVTADRGELEAVAAAGAARIIFIR